MMFAKTNRGNEFKTRRLRFELKDSREINKNKKSTWTIERMSEMHAARLPRPFPCSLASSSSHLQIKIGS